MDYFRNEIGRLKRLILEERVDEGDEAIGQCAYLCGATDVLARYGVLRSDLFLDGALQVMSYADIGTGTSHSEAYLRGVRDIAKAFGLKVPDKDVTKGIFPNEPQGVGIVLSSRRVYDTQIRGIEIDLFNYMNMHPGKHSSEDLYRNVWKKPIPKPKERELLHKMKNKVQVAVTRLRAKLRLKGEYDIVNDAYQRGRVGPGKYELIKI